MSRNIFKRLSELQILGTVVVKSFRTPRLCQLNPIVNKSCNLECCSNKMHRTIANIYKTNFAVKDKYIRLAYFILDMGNDFIKVLGHCCHWNIMGTVSEHFFKVHLEVSHSPQLHVYYNINCKYFKSTGCYWSLTLKKFKILLLLVSLRLHKLSVC